MINNVSSAVPGRPCLLALSNNPPLRLLRPFFGRFGCCIHKSNYYGFSCHRGICLSLLSGNNIFTETMNDYCAFPLFSTFPGTLNFNLSHPFCFPLHRVYSSSERRIPHRQRGLGKVIEYLIIRLPNCQDRILQFTTTCTTSITPSFSLRTQTLRKSAVR